MDKLELLDTIACGETSKVQFKKSLTAAESISRELVAMANSIGGMLLIGVEDTTGAVTGLTQEQIEYADRKIAEYADNIKPPIYIQTEVVKVDNTNVLIVHINEGINKPYKTAQGEIYVKQASNKRLVTDNAEIMRLFQQSGNLLADEMEVFGTSLKDIDEILFRDYFIKEFGQGFSEKGLNYEQALIAKRVLRNKQITLAGLLFFGKEPQKLKPAFTIKTVSFFGNDIETTNYRSKPFDLIGTIPSIFRISMEWVKSNLFNLQNGQDFNSIGILEVSEIALVELIQNALIHRDYFKNSPIRIFIFDNRIEIISPGKLPNSLTIEDIKYGNPVIRNNQLLSFAMHSLPFSGLGSGIRRALKEQANIELINDIEGEQFIVKIPRPERLKS